MSVRRRTESPFLLGAMSDLRVRSSWAGSTSTHRGHWDGPTSHAKSQTYVQRALELKRKERRGGQRHSDDSVVYSESKSSQSQASAMRPTRRRGESFNVGRLSSTPDRNISSRGHSYSSDPPWPGAPSDPRRAYSHDNSGRYRDGQHWSPGQSYRDKEQPSDINRRNSDGQTLSAGGSSFSQQQQRQLLLSMKSSPNLAKPPDGSDAKEEAAQPPKGPSHLTKSSPNIFDEVELQDAKVRALSLGMLHSSSDFSMKHGGSLGSFNNNNNTSSSTNMYNPDYYNYKNTSREHMRRSLPAHNLHRYQPDYENVVLLRTEPIGSEKISEIDDIDEVTGKDSNPQSPDVKPYNPLGGAGLPTRDPASLKYIKVNQNHEKYPSWPVTKPSGASEETQPINTRAQSMTDNTNTSKEFPQKQRLAYTPGLRPLIEKNSPVAERKSDGRNTSDPGIKSEFVYDKFGRVIRRSNNTVEHRFEDFYQNSQPGYPPPKMDPDGHNIGDKEYNAPSPPERESKGLDSHELSSRLTGSDDYSRYHQMGNFTRLGNSNLSSTYNYQESYRGGPSLRPTNLNLNFSKQPMEQTSKVVDTGTSPLDKGSPLNHRDIRSNSQGDTSQATQQQQQSRPRSWHDPFKQGSPLQSWQERNYQNDNRQQSPNTQSPSAQVSAKTKQADLTDRPSPNTDSSTHLGPQRDRPGSDKSKAYIVKSTPYYNTSTQTESSVPYAIKLSNPATVASKLRNVETQVGEFGTQTSPKTPEDQKKMFEEKSIQARMSRDFQNSEVDQKFSSYEGKKPNEDNIFRYPASSFNKLSPFTGIQNIHAKYATDESPITNTSSETSKNSTPAFNDNSASILRKLSEEFYGNKLGMMADKRMSSSSSQEQSPKFEMTISASTLQQPGLREAESYSSVVIHHEETGGLFGRDDYGSMSSVADSSKPDSSYPFLDVSKKTEAAAAVKTRRSLDPVFLSQKNQQMDIKASSTTSGPGLQREISCPAISGYPSISSSLSTSKSYNAFPHSASASELSTAHPRPKSSSSESRSSQGTAFSGRSDSTSMASNNDLTAATSNTQNKVLAQSTSEDQRRKRMDSDSVFISTDDDTTDYQFDRKPSLRKAYGIYDETERLISQSSNVLSAKQMNKGKDPTRLSQDGSGGSTSSVYVPMSRGNKYSESQTLGLIQEEGDNPNILSDSSGVFSSLSSWSQSGRREEPTKYHWQSESWLKSQADLAKGSNLKRTTSEQIAQSRPTSGGSNKFSSHEAETGQFRLADKTGAVAFPGPSPTNFDHRPSSSVAELTSSGHARTHSEDLTQLNEPSLRKFQQQALLSFIHRKTQGGGGSSSHTKDNFSTDSSMYESIEGNSSESVADIISKATENLVKSAQRVDSIRRSNSVSSRSSDYMDMTKYDRMRRETEWSKLRSSGSLRYGPDDERRSRSSFASENHYEDISLFSPSTPRDSFAESVDIIVDTTNPDASMDSGLVASPTYQNYPSKRRPPPPLPRSPSPDAPPALPPRKYRETESAPPAEAGDVAEAALQGGDKNRVHTIPLGKPQLEDASQVDNTKRDFRSLMSQWENSSPREDKYAAELRKQAQKLTGHQQQQQSQLSAMPMAVMHSKPKISVATTYKREPTQPQEATSPSPSSLSSSSMSSLPSLHSNSNAPSSSTVGGPSASPTSSTSAFQSTSSSNVSAAWNQQQQQPRSDSASTTAANSASGQPAVNNNSITHTASSSVRLIHGHSQASSSSPSTAPQLLERTFFFAEEHRLRSSSEVLHHGNSQLASATTGGDSGNKNATPEVRKPLSLRERSASDHDVLSERRQQPQETYIGASPDGTPMAVTKWRQEQGSAVYSTTSAARAGDSMITDAPDPSQGFAEESYIGHRNKSSRAIGTYKRSKSAAVLQGNGESAEENDQKLGQQSWNSESVLTTQDSQKEEELQADVAEAGTSLHNEPIPEHDPASAAQPPVRPARPSAHARSSGGPQNKSGVQVPLSSSPTGHSSLSLDYGQDGQRQGQHLASVELSTLESVSAGLASQQGAYRDTRWSNSEKSRTLPGSIPLSQYSPQRRVPAADNSTLINNNNNISAAWSVQGSKGSPSPSSQGICPAEPAVPPRDYQRRESAPTKTLLPTAGTDKLSVAVDTTPRRRSDSSVNTSRSDHSSSDLSSAGHSRQPSQEELECDQKAQQLAQELANKEQKLSEVLRLDSTKKRMQFMDGLFSESMDGGGGPWDRPAGFNPDTRSSLKNRTLPARSDGLGDIPDVNKRGSLPKEYFMSPSKALLEMELRNNEEVSKDMTKNINDSDSLMKQKEELMGKLHKKLEILKEAKEVLQQEIAENDQLGKQVQKVIDTKCQTQSEKDKFNTYIDDLEKIVRLLLNLSGQLARAENAVQALAPDVDAKLKKLTVDKRERLYAKHEEAKLLKDDIDKRSEQLSLVLRERLDEVEFSDYTHYIRMKSKLTIDLQELEDKITLGGEQIVELKKSIPDHKM